MGERKEYHEVAEEEFCHLDFFGAGQGVPRLNNRSLPVLSDQRSNLIELVPEMFWYFTSYIIQAKI
jgi:hypothetical protein